jgi:hypothetical protein
MTRGIAINRKSVSTAEIDTAVAEWSDTFESFDGIGQKLQRPSSASGAQLNSMSWPCRSNGMNEPNEPALMNCIMRCSGLSASLLVGARRAAGHQNSRCS